MRNIKLTIAYDGTRYSGWQFQKNSPSIQETIQKAIMKITGEKVSLVGSGRTDAGVHALAQVANFHTRSKLPVKNIQMALNRSLPRDIVVVKAEEAEGAFNSQHSAKSKLYRYTIFNNDFISPFIRHFAAKCFYKLDMPKMKKSARHLAGRHDFRAFKTMDGDNKDSVRTIKRIGIVKNGSMVYIDIEADGFLYNMARVIAGVLVEAGRGKISPGQVKEILVGRDRGHCGPTMPAKGLCLIKVRY